MQISNLGYANLKFRLCRFEKRGNLERGTAAQYDGLAFSLCLVALLRKDSFYR